MPVNEGIQASEVRLIDENGQMLGVVSRREALALAAVNGLDLVMINNADQVPVCKIMDYGKHRYDVQKKMQQNKKRQKIVEVKEIKIGPSIHDHDYQVKIQKAKKVLSEGNRVKFIAKLRGRELMFKQRVYDLFGKINSDLQLYAQIAQQHSKGDVDNGYFFCVYVPNVDRPQTE